LEKGVDSTGLALIYDNIGMENLELKFYPEAVKYLNKAIFISERLKDTLQLLMDYSNLGVAYRRQDSLYKAEIYYLKAFEIAVKNNMEETIARLSMNLGIIYSKQKNYEKALEYYRTSLEKCETLSIKYGITLNLINMGVAYYETGQFLKAEESDKRALEYIKQLKLPKEEQVLYSGFYLMYKKWGKPEKALYYFEKYKDLSDSLLNETKQKQFMEIQTKYETEKKELEIALLQKESVEKDFESLIIISLSTTLIFIMSFLVYRNRKLRKIEQQKAENLKIKLDSKNSELACKAISIAQQQTKIKNYWNDISQKLQENNVQIPGFWEPGILN
jgi:tetratricopeptide (TPR) repeat protein